jgi:hypothetical protein
MKQDDCVGILRFSFGPALRNVGFFVFFIISVLILAGCSDSGSSAEFLMKSSGGTVSTEDVSTMPIRLTPKGAICSVSTYDCAFEFSHDIA